jgi:adenylate cyclase
MMRDQPKTKENDELRALAGGQLLTFGWREGMAVEEAKAYADEALSYAREAGNRKHESLLIAAYGRIVAANGSADEYVTLVREALTITDAKSNPEGALLLTALLGQAYAMAGLVGDALSANDAALAMIDDERQGNAGVVLGLDVGQMVGFDVPYWIRCQRPGRLTLLGRFAEADEWLARIFQTDPDNIDLIHQGIPHITAVELAWFRGDAKSAGWHANELASLASRAGNAYWSVVMNFCHGQAEAIKKDFTKADGFFAAALDLSRRSKAGLDYEARILANRADILDRAGERRFAGQMAAEAIRVARSRAMRLAECHASLVAARVWLAQTGSRHSPEGSWMLDRAKALIQETGAKAFEPMMLRLNAEMVGERS